jgi:hypothetical protein
MEERKKEWKKTWKKSWKKGWDDDGRRARYVFSTLRLAFSFQNTNPSINRTSDYIRYQYVSVSAHQYAVPAVDEPSSVRFYQYRYHGPCSPTTSNTNSTIAAISVS